MADYLTICEQAARAGGKLLLDWHDRFTPREKSPRDLVTEADLASQREIRKVVLDAFPDHDFLGEEDAGLAAEGDASARNPESPYRWIVDPLDGTANYVHHLQTFAVSIALTYQDELIAGCVFDPVSKECYTAAKGKGAFLNGKRLQTSICTEPNKAMVAVSFSPNVPRGSIEIQRFLEALHACQSVRRLGSAALNLAYVAAGRLDCYFTTSVSAWDVAAGFLIVQEAGGTICGLHGEKVLLEKPHFIASSTVALATEMQAILKRAQTVESLAVNEAVK